MEIIGNGFIARSLQPIAEKYPDTVVLAAGVSWASGTAAADFDREARLLHRTAADCRRTGRRLLFFSTAATGMYGLVDGPGREDLPVVPCTPYGVHKLALEEQLRDSGADHLVLRLGHLVGPGQPAHQLLPTLVRQIRDGDVRIHRGAARDLIDVADVITVIDRLLAQDLSGEIVNVASGEAVPVELIVDRLELGLGCTARRHYQDAGTHHVIAIDKLRALVPETDRLGFGPRYFERIVDDFAATVVAATAS
ncbi:NAD-dependent epimerase/dehydratase family protein [Kitasatospora sp. NPDC089509]|uniref:NAD-dependent epimerase/dehydratase family protein n=1 Tax=Kitasatospora sp. NPDC089509 TaxID=3364079 RepID=UPI00381BCC90